MKAFENRVCAPRSIASERGRAEKAAGSRHPALLAQSMPSRASAAVASVSSVVLGVGWGLYIYIYIYTHVSCLYRVVSWFCKVWQVNVLSGTREG